MFRLAFILPLLLGACACALVVAEPSSSGITLIGGTSQERAAVTSLIEHRLSEVASPSQPIVIQLVTPTELRADVAASEATAQNSVPSGTSDASGEDADIDGLYQDDPPTITLLSGEPVADMQMTLAHEFGHHLWNFFMNGNDHKAYSDIYARQLAANQLITDYSKESVEEGFAEAFSYYLLQPKKLKNKDSASYNYLDTLITRLELAHSAHPQNALQPSEQPQSFHITPARLRN